MSYAVSVCTLGCRVNQYESRAIEERFAQNGFEIRRFGEKCDVCVVNTCAVTGESERKSRQMLSRARKSSPDAVICAVGCYSQLSPQRLADVADIILGTADKTRLVDLVTERLAERTRAPHIDVSFPADELCDGETVHSIPRVRAFVKIQDGCDGKCAYCTIAAARGHVRCKTPDTVVSEIEELCRGGVREVTLVGIELSAYRFDLIDLIRRVCDIDGIERVRLGSLDPRVLTDEFCRMAASCGKLAPHFHISLQSGCTKTLLAMRRRYTADTALNNILKLRDALPRLMLSCDLIVGFPGESDVDFAETVDFLERARFLHIHVFPFSPRPGTPAATMPDQIPPEVKSAREKKVLALDGEIKASLLKSALSEPSLPVIFETAKDGMIYGHTDNFIEVKATGDIPPCGITDVRPLSLDGDIIEAEII